MHKRIIRFTSGRLYRFTEKLVLRSSFTRTVKRYVNVMVEEITRS